MLPEYQALYEINSDIVGWVNIGNGLLSTPVMQRDNEYYLTHNFYGEEDNHGQVFLDERNSPDHSSNSLRQDSRSRRRRSVSEGIRPLAIFSS